MHAAADDIPTSLYPKIKALVMFGDGVLRLGAERARFPAGLDEKTRQVCADGDPVCCKPKSEAHPATMMLKCSIRPAILMASAPSST